MKCNVCGKPMIEKYIPESQEVMFHCHGCNVTYYLGGPDYEDQIEL